MSTALREEFPLLETCLYLNSNSTGAVPRGVEQVLGRYWQTMRSWRDEVWERWFEDLRTYAETVERLIGGPPGSVVIDANLSTLLGRVASSFDFRSPRNVVITTDLEFPTVPFIWRGFSRYGAQVEVVRSNGPAFDQDALERQINRNTLLVCVSHASYSTGAVVDLQRVIARAHEVGALVIVDAYQTIGVMPLDVTALDADFVLGGSHKWLCGAQTAFLYVRPDLAPSLTPAATGWLAGDDPLTFLPATGWASDARRFAGGTPFPLAALISQVGLDLLASVGVKTIREHSLRCTDRIIGRAEAAGITVISPLAPHQRGGVVCLSFPGDREVVRRLAQRRMICSWRSSLRVAPHIYNTIEEIDAFMDAVELERRRDLGP